MQYEWFQDDNQIIIRFEIKNTRLSNINVEIADLVVKVNVLDKKFVKTVDLYAPVTEGSVKYGNNILEVQLNKQTPQKWQQLKPDLTKEEIIQRRQESFRRKEGELLKQKQQKEDLKIQFDKHATQEQMRIDDNQRKEIDSIKLKQKQEAEEQIYQKMDQKANFVQADKQAYESDEEEEQEVQEKNIIENKVENNNNKVQTKEQNNKNEIFTEKDLKAQKERQQKPIPEPRKAAQVQIPFTEKVYPHLAAREQHFRDAPLPRQAKLTQKDYEDRQNPLFLKDKGDELFRNKDFYSAINAYSLAYKLDQNLIICLSNRSACHLNLFNYEECFNDCQTVIEYYQNKQIDDHILQKCLQRKQICLAWKGNLDECNSENYQEIINQRKQSNQYKNQGDSFLKVSQYDQAKQMYHKGLEYDKENEGCLSNLGLLYLKTHDYANAIQYIDQCIHKVEPFVQHVNLNPQIEQSNKKGFDLLIKNYLRKATSYLQLNQEDNALDAIKSALKIEPLNDEARTIFNKIQARQQKQQAIKLKESATQKLKDKQYQEALHQYNQCLQQITPQEDLIDFLAVLLNKCICLYFLEQFDEILGACTRGIKLIQSQKNKVLAFQAISKEDQQKLDDYLIRFLCRRSNAHLKQSQLYHAISDLEEAIKLDPQNEALKKDLNKIKPV